MTWSGRTTPALAPFHLTPWVRRLLVANGVVYLLGITIFSERWLITLLGFSPVGAATHPWTFFSYMFVHVGFLHLAFNMLMLFFFGPPVEERMGGGTFIRFYLLCGLGGPVLAFAISLFQPVAPFVGASAAVFGVAVAFAWYWPRAQVFIFPFPFPVQVRYLIAALIALNVFPVLLHIQDGIAHLAHLGGLIVAFAYLYGERAIGRTGTPKVAAETPVRVLVHHSVKRTKHPPQAASEEKQRETSPADDLDRVLDKISRTGMDSLTAAERRILDEMSRQLRKD